MKIGMSITIVKSLFTFAGSLFTFAGSLFIIAASLLVKIPSVGTDCFRTGNNLFLQQKQTVSAFETFWKRIFLLFLTCHTSGWKVVKAE